MKQKSPSVAATKPIRPQTKVVAPPVKARKDDVNWLNIGLMVVACAISIAAPFQVFLLAWSILGPLHYLTEISWLHDRNYFTRRNTARRSWLVLVIFAVL